LWFEGINGPRSHFKMGAIDYNTHHQSIMFINGRNRTILLSTLMDRVPLALDDDALSEPGVRRGLLGRINAADMLALPEFPILTFAELGGVKS
jgi:hypothetical protein